MRTTGFTLLILAVIALAIDMPAGAAPKQAETPAGKTVGGSLISVLNPTGFPPPIARKPMAPRPETLDGKTVYLVDLTFDNGDVLLKQMQGWFARNMPRVKTVFRAKKGLYAADDPGLWKEIQEAQGLMIMAIGH